MNKWTTRLLVVLGIMLGACVLTLVSVSAEPSVQLLVQPGESWIRTHYFFIFPLRSPPQLAAWLESADGSFLKTLTVSQSAAGNRWKAAPKEGRPEALPVGLHRSASVADSLNVDAASSATYQDAISLERSLGALLTNGESYRVYLEVNHSFDYNASWPKNASRNSLNWSGVNGQPSLVYMAEFVAGDGQVVELHPVGQGAVDGSHGRVIPGTDGLDSALRIISRASLSL